MISRIRRAIGICWNRRVVEPRYLIDTNCCIYLFTGAYPALSRRVNASAVGSIAISAIVLAELAHGSERGLAPPADGLRMLAEQMPVLPFDAAATRAYAALPFERGNFDRLIAAHSIALGMTIISRNLRDFAQMPGVRVEDWTA